MMKVLILLLAIVHCNVWATESYTDRKIMLLHSYHDGYPWTRDITKGVKDKLLGTGVELKIFYMDTKRRRLEQEKQAAAVKAKIAIDTFAPDVLISADDDASKYVIMPFYKNTDLPVIFCGVNMDASAYGFTEKETQRSIVPNITGMIEVHPTDYLIKHLQRYAKGNRIGSLSFDAISERKSVRHAEQTLGRPFDKVYRHTDYEDWKKSFLKLQHEVDMLFLYNPYGLKGFNLADATQFVDENISIPIGTTLPARMPFSVFGLVQLGSEQGKWATSTALRILDGESPADIPVTRNKGGKLMINIRLVNKLQLKVDLKLLKTAEIVK
ncbi:ABC transporter substrate binding protein [Candidatus Albibeggiatoa sp. nov. NOAA]|uniref:ABC transporter substrate-binding protein n=1 Tax=Candidatus Albibeggiatoa sp. nov. NOAA TaxID=3162724 RepID=UPI0032F76361|nr:ABC transporter substrate-binding protein [Thiotrichaceae bacterium]